MDEQAISINRDAEIKRPVRSTAGQQQEIGKLVDRIPNEVADTVWLVDEPRHRAPLLSGEIMKSCT